MTSREEAAIRRTIKQAHTALDAGDVAKAKKLLARAEDQMWLAEYYGQTVGASVLADYQAGRVQITKA